MTWGMQRKDLVKGLNLYAGRNFVDFVALLALKSQTVIVCKSISR